MITDIIKLVLFILAIGTALILADVYGGGSSSGSCYGSYRGPEC